MLLASRPMFRVSLAVRHSPEPSTTVSQLALNARHGMIHPRSLSRSSPRVFDLKLRPPTREGQGFVVSETPLAARSLVLSRNHVKGLSGRRSYENAPALPVLFPLGQAQQEHARCQPQAKSGQVQHNPPLHAVDDVVIFCIHDPLSSLLLYWTRRPVKG